MKNGGLFYAVVCFITSCLIIITFTGAAYCSEPKYPTKTVTLVVPWGPGGATDIAARVLASIIPQFLGQPVVVINKPGASGSIAFEYIRKQEPNGYILKMGAGGDSVQYPARNPKLPYSYDDITAIARTQTEEFVLVISPKSPYKTFADLEEKLRLHPGKVKYGTAGTASTQWVSVQMMLKELGLQTSAARSVNYDSAAAAVLGVMQGEVDISLTNLPTTLSHLKAGMLRGLVQVPKKRLEELPDIPTFAELGYPGIDVITWMGVIGPPGLPDNIVRVWEEAVRKATQTKYWLKMTKRAGDTPGYLNSKDFMQFITSEFKRYRALYTEWDLLVK